MKGWPAVFAALLIALPHSAPAAENLDGAARELARKTVAFAGKGEPVAVSWRNASLSGGSELGRARTLFEWTVEEAGGRIGEAPVDVRITLSENQDESLLVAEAHKGEERQVWIAAWKRAKTSGSSAPAVTLERRLVWEQEEQILDVGFPADAMLVLSPAKVTLYSRRNGAWEAENSVRMTVSRPWPRDLRGRLRVKGSAFEVSLPGVACSGALTPALSLECRPAEEPWLLESGSHAMLLANYVPTRNYFGGRVATQAGLRKTVPPFYSAATAEEQGQTLWLLAMLDGHTQIFDSALNPVGSIPGWGSDIVGISVPCGAGSQVLATRPGDSGERDSIQAFAMVNHAPAPMAASLDFDGAVTAFWPSGGTSAVAVTRNPATGAYAAYVITVACGS